VKLMVRTRTPASVGAGVGSAEIVGRIQREHDLGAELPDDLDGRIRRVGGQPAPPLHHVGADLWADLQGGWQSIHTVRKKTVTLDWITNVCRDFDSLNRLGAPNCT